MKIHESFWTRLWMRLARKRAPLSDSSARFDLAGPASRARVLVILEGANDIEFLRRISAMLHAHAPRLPDLAAMDRRGELVFVPFGGGGLWPWAYRLAHLGRPEFHLYYREVPPETEVRRQVAQIVNFRPGCRATVTAKRNLENYLHPRAIFEAGGVEVEFSDEDLVADLVAQRLHQRQGDQPVWEALLPRARKRRRNRVKQWLNTLAVDRMMPERLEERDPEGEVRSWLEVVARLADRSG